MSQVPIGDRRAIKNPNLKFKLETQNENEMKMKNEIGGTGDVSQAPIVAQSLSPSH